jgi:hypothetical protein
MSASGSPAASGGPWRHTKPPPREDSEESRACQPRGSEGRPGLLNLRWLHRECRLLGVPMDILLITAGPAPRTRLRLIFVCNTWGRVQRLRLSLRGATHCCKYFASAM